MKFFIFTILQLFFFESLQSYAVSDNSIAMQQLKNKVIVLEFAKYDESKMDNLVHELNSYNGKIAEAIFDTVTHHLTIYYLVSIQLDDVLEVVSKSGMDFNKISGTELE